RQKNLQHIKALFLVVHYQQPDHKTSPYFDDFESTPTPITQVYGLRCYPPVFSSYGRLVLIRGLYGGQS
ncbi:MAG: hypothetical protein ACLPUX_07455, partial [Syntrophobacteraceae bacterium]